MIINFNSENLEDPSKYYHSHASGNDNIFITSGMVSRKDQNSGLNYGVKAQKNSSNEIVYLHDVKLQFEDIVNQLEIICSDLNFSTTDIRDHILETRVYIVDLKKYFSEFNTNYGNWMGKRKNYPARTTIGVFDLPSNVILEMAFTLSK